MKKEELKVKKIKKELERKSALLECAKDFGLLGDLTRMKICYLLCNHKELSVSEIAEIVGVSVSAVSHTLAKMKKAKLVKEKRIFKNVYYSLDPSHYLTKILKLRFEKVK